VTCPAAGEARNVTRAATSAVVPARLRELVGQWGLWPPAPIGGDRGATTPTRLGPLSLGEPTWDSLHNSTVEPGRRTTTV
jgi:hypothetical protein